MKPGLTASLCFFAAICALPVPGLAESSGLSRRPGPDSSWEEIRKAGLVPTFPTIFFRSMGITVDELCLDGDQIRPFQPWRKACVEWDPNPRHSERCIREESVYLSTPRAFTETVCMEYRPGDSGTCRKQLTRPAAHRTHYEISVNEIRPKAGQVEVFRKAFDLSVCE